MVVPHSPRTYEGSGHRWWRLFLWTVSHPKLVYKFEHFPDHWSSPPQYQAHSEQGPQKHDWTILGETQSALKITRKWTKTSEKIKCQKHLRIQAKQKNRNRRISSTLCYINPKSGRRKLHPKLADHPAWKDIKKQAKTHFLSLHFGHLGLNEHRCSERF